MSAPNIDTEQGMDFHKTWDVFVPEGMDPKTYLLLMFKRGKESDNETLARIASWPSAQTAPPHVAAILRAHGLIEKHLRGLHDQKTHGHRGAGLQKTGWRADIESLLIKHQEHSKEPESTFAATLLRLGTEYPEVAKNFRGVNLSPGALDDSDAVGAMAAVRFTDHGLLVLMDPAKVQHGAQEAYRKVVLSQERPYGTPAINRSGSFKESRFVADYIEGVAVHEFGHAAHFHYEAVMQRGEGSVGRSRDDLDSVRLGMANESTTGSVKALTNYALKNNREKMAEWFAGYYFDMLPEGFSSPRFTAEFEEMLTRPVSLKGGVIKRQQGEDLCDGHQHEDTVAETVATLGIKSRRGVAVIEKGTGRLDRSPKSNWVEEAGGLPRYIEDIAHALHTKRGMPISRAIAVAISRVKMWAAGGGDVDPDTRAKAAKAVAEWTALKAKNKAKD